MLSQWDDMIGSDSAPESGTDDEDEEHAPRRKSRQHDSGDEDSSDDASESDIDTSDPDSDSDSDSDSGSSSSSSPRSKKRKATTSSSSRSQKVERSRPPLQPFLPSLATGFIAGRSDDEWSDAEADLADATSRNSNPAPSKKERKKPHGSTSAQSPRREEVRQERQPH